MSAFRDAISKEIPAAAAAVKVGKQALKGEHRDMIQCKASKRLVASVDLDAALAAAAGHGSASRWDYGVGWRLPDSQTEAAVWIEVHPASTSEVSTILKKLDWLQAWLQGADNELKKLTDSACAAQVSPFIWLATSAPVAIRPGSPQSRQLSQRGLATPTRRLTLP